MSKLYFSLLGPVTAGVELGSAKQRAVLVMLLLRAGRPVGRDEIIDGVWGEAPPPSAANLVATYVARLRRAIEPGRERRAAAQVLVSTATGYELRVPPQQIDVEVFEQLVTQGRLDEALALWRGQPLDGIPGPFAAAHRARLIDRHLTVFERHVAERGGDWTAELTRLIQEHPYRERLRALLITTLHRDGRHAEALKVFLDARRTLAEDLGVEPGPELRRAHRTVLSGNADRYLQDVREAARMLSPGRGASSRFATYQDAFDWLEREREAIVAAGLVSQNPMLAAEFATHLRSFMHRRGYWSDLRKLAATAATQDHDHASAQGLLEMGGVDFIRRRLTQADAHVRHSLMLFRMLCDVPGTRRALNNLSMVRAESGDHDEAWSLAQEHLALSTDQAERSVALDSLALIEIRRGRFHEAVGYCEQSIEIHNAIGSPLLASAALNLLGHAYAGLGEHDSAVFCQRRSTQLSRLGGNRHREALALRGLASAYQAQGNATDAAVTADQATRLLSQLS